MRKTELLKIAWPALLAETRGGWVTIFYRGVNERGESLYEIENRYSVVVAEGTEKQVLESLLNKGG